jgi:CheY-like chemotaxis protein
MPRPTFVLVVEDGSRLEALRRDLSRRYEADYQVIAVASAAAALGTLRDLGGSGVVVALVFADERMAGMNAVDFLVRARDLHPGAKRVLLIERGDWSAVHPAVSAMALGKIDYHLYDPWHPPERILYQAVGEFLAAWERAGSPLLLLSGLSARRTRPAPISCATCCLVSACRTGSSMMALRRAGGCCGSTAQRVRACRWPFTTTARSWSTRRTRNSWASWACARA